MNKGGREGGRERGREREGEGGREGEGREMKRGKDKYIYNDDMAKLVLIHVTFIIMTNLTVHSALCQYM